MGILLWFLGGGGYRAEPERVPTDDVMPLHLFDDASYLRGYTLIWTFKFLEILDADMLNRTLSNVFEADGWRKLGGRLRKRPDGKIEVHVPKEFTAERPSLHFTKQHYDISINEHPEASKLPAATDQSTLFPGPKEYASLAVGPGAPMNLDDYLHSDVPQFALHVVTFTDATLVSINFNHIVCDAVGFRAVLDAWQHHLAGQPKAQAEFMSIEDGMAGLYQNPPAEKQGIGHLMLSGWSKAKWVMWFLWDTWSTTYDQRTACVPKVEMDKLLQVARNDLTLEVDNTAEIQPFIAEGDLFLAIAVRLAAWSLSPTSTRSINMIAAVDPRGRVTSVFRQDAAYVQNAPAGVMVVCTSTQAREMSLARLAWMMREAIAAQTTEAQLRVTAHVLAESMKQTGNVPAYGDPSGMLAVSSNWSRAKLLQLDLSRAIVKQASAPLGKDSSWRPGLPVYYHSRSLNTGAFSTSVLIIVGRDHEGNMWLCGDYPAHVWPKLVDLVKKEASRELQ